MKEVALKTHLIITDIQDEYSIEWCGKFKDAKPMIKNDLPVFIVVGSEGRFELNCLDMKFIEDCAKSAAKPKGRESFTSDQAYIYLLEEDENETLIGIVTHSRIKKYAPMFDKVGWR